MQLLVEVPIMLLTEETDSYRKPTLKHHLKYLRRLRALRLAQPLTSAALPDLQHFTRLNQLYLDRGTDSLSTLAEIPRHIKSPAPVSLILGLSATVTRPLYAGRPEIHSASLPVVSSEPLLLENDSCTLIVRQRSRSPSRNLERLIGARSLAPPLGSLDRRLAWIHEPLCQSIHVI